MNRRQFLLGSTALPVAGHMFTLHEIQQSLLVDESLPVHVIARIHPTADSAERYRRQWNESPFETFGEWYVSSATVRRLPSHLSRLPGTLTYFTATVGVAAERRSYMAGAFRRENIAYIVRSQVDDENLIIAFGDFFAEAKLPTLFSTTWHAGNLSNLIPTARDLGLPVETTDMRWW